MSADTSKEGVRYLHITDSRFLAQEATASVDWTVHGRDGACLEHNVARFRRWDIGVQQQATIGERKKTFDEHITIQRSRNLNAIRDGRVSKC